MKKIYFIFLFFTLQLAAWSQQQLTVTATGNDCQADFKFLSVNFGTVTPGNVSWTSMPAGAVFSVSPSTATVSFPSAGAYTVFVLSMFSNSVAAGSMSFTIIPSPTITLSQSSLTTCLINNPSQQQPFSISKPVLLMATGSNTYTIFPYMGTPVSEGTPGNFTVRPSSTTCYTVLGASVNGCAVAVAKCVTVVPQFTIQLNPSPANVCINASVSLNVSNVQSTATGPASSFAYNWYEATNAPPPSLNDYGSASVTAYPQNTTTYTVDVIDAAGCISAPAQILVNVGLCTAIKENYSSTDWLAFPNPVKDKFKLNSEFNGSISEVEVMNTLGERVYSNRRINANEELDIAFLAPGIYFVHVETKSGLNILKIVKE